jgi:hypothetical protein
LGKGFRLYPFMRKLRHVPEPRTLVEITTRTLQGMLLLRPGSLLNDIILGVLGRAQRLYQVEIHAYCFLSTHYHLLITVEDAGQLCRFMTFFNSNLAREVARLTGWKEKIWSRRYQHIVISGEEEAQVARLKYVLAHGPKENLVPSPLDWPGVHSAKPMIEGGEIQGTWFNRTREYTARRKGQELPREEITQAETVVLTPLPCWSSSSPEAYRRQVAFLVDQIVAEAKAERDRLGIEPLGREAVLRQNPLTRPGRLKKSPAPLFHAFRRRVRRLLYEAYTAFVAAFREASSKLRGGDRNAVFPIGSFPPGAPFISGAPPWKPA